MPILTAVLLGLVYGITEFLPVSGTGHMALLAGFFHIEADLLLSVLLRAGTLLAVFLVYRRDISAVLQGGLGLLGLGRDRGKTTRKNIDRRRMAMFIVLGTLPLLAALALRDVADRLGQNPAFVGLMLMAGGGILYLTDRNARGHRTLRDSSLGHGLLVGLAQALAVFPGLSRTGLAISAGMFCGFRRSFAVQLAYLLSVPAVLAGLVLRLMEAMEAGVDTGALPVYLGGMAAATISGYFSIRLMRLLAARSRFGGFAYYCWGAGIVALALSLVA